MTLSQAFIPRREVGAESSRVGGELVVLDGQGKTLRGLNATAARAWELIDGERSASEIAAAVAGEFSASADVVLADLLAFFEQLRARGLVREVAQ